MYSNKLYISVYWFFHKNVFSKQYSIVVIVVDLFALHFSFKYCSFVLLWKLLLHLHKNNFFNYLSKVSKLVLSDRGLDFTLNAFHYHPNKFE